MLKMFKNNTTINSLMKMINLNPGISKMIGVSISVFFLVHLMSCLWFLMPKFLDFGPDSWVTRAGMVESDVGAQYLTSMYWAF